MPCHVQGVNRMNETVLSSFGHFHIFSYRKYEYLHGQSRAQYVKLGQYQRDLLLFPMF
jgi:hypothetical protein